jgi:hypothetical protein
MNLSLCGDDGGVKDLEEVDPDKDQRMSSSSPDLFFSVCGQTVAVVNFFVVVPFTDVAPFEE